MDNVPLFTHSVETIANCEVVGVFNNYPQCIREKLLFLRQLILDTALERDGVGTIEETLKWGEPSYISKTGSTIRIGWKSKHPHQYALYFNCRTKLVDTFRVLYADQLLFEGNRAIVFNENDKIPILELKHCISLSLKYHKIKHLPLLGA